MFMRRRGAPLLAAAAIAGTAAYAGKKSAEGQAAPAVDMAQLKQLGDLHAAGVLTDEEFAAAKAKVLG